MNESTIEPVTTALALLASSDLMYDIDTPEYREHLERGAGELARIFDSTTANMRRLWAEFDANLAELGRFMNFGPDAYIGSAFDVRLHYDGSVKYDYKEKKGIDEIIDKMNVRVWEILVSKMGIKNIMSVKRRAEFDDQIKKGDVPPVTEANIISFIMGLADRAGQYATEAAKETLALLTPGHSSYKTNSGFKVGKRAILSWYVERNWDGKGFRASHYHEQHIIAIDATFHLLDEKGPIRERKSPFLQAIGETVGGKGETPYFSFKCYKNHNMHVEFKRLDLVKKLNGLATGEYVLGQDID